jgi:hypothetical protein
MGLQSRVLFIVLKARSTSIKSLRVVSLANIHMLIKTIVKGVFLIKVEALINCLK